jgi:nitric oxide dioxygenase
MPLTQDQIDIVKSTAPVLKEYGNAITSEFYRTMLSENPSLKNMFNLRNQETGAQQKALAGSVIAYATYIDDLPKLKHAVERIAHKHVSLFVEPAQYDIVGKYLIRAIGTILGDAVTPEIADAWTAAYAQLAQVFIKREGEMYAANGPWTGWRKFKIIKKEPESESVTSFYLAPVDGTPLPRYLPGQYISLQVTVPGLDGLKQSRQFSFSEAPADGKEYYRVSVKREQTIEGATAEDIGKGLVPGLMSNLLHEKYQVGDEVELSAPAGEFFLDPSDKSAAEAPLVLISAGVGATPILAIAQSVLAADSPQHSRPVTWLQASKSSKTLCFRDQVRGLASANPTMRASIFLDSVGEADVKGQDFDVEGTMDLEKVDAEADLHVKDDKAEYFICGPEAWMIALRSKLSGMGVAWDRMHLELFATGDVPGQ